MKLKESFMLARARGFKEACQGLAQACKNQQASPRNYSETAQRALSGVCNKVLSHVVELVSGPEDLQGYLTHRLHNRARAEKLVKGLPEKAHHDGRRMAFETVKVFLQIEIDAACRLPNKPQKDLPASLVLRVDEISDILTSFQHHAHRILTIGRSSEQKPSAKSARRSRPK